MNYAENNQDTNEIKPTTEARPAVLTRVPWLESTQGASESPAVSLENFVVDESAGMDDAWLMPHQAVASPNWDPASQSRADSPRLVRIDPPQPLATASASQTSMTVDECLAKQPDERTIVTIDRPVARPATSDSGITHLRFDPPVQPVPSSTDKPGDMAAPSPASWHESVATIDNLMRQYSRVIVLAALLTAAGLMMLVLEAQQTEAEPAPDGVTPAALDATGIMPLPLADAEPRSTTPPQVAETVATAKGPGSDTKRPPTASAELECIPLEPLQPYREPRVDIAALPSLASTPPTEMQTVEESAQGETLAQVESPVQSETSAAPVTAAYPSTGATAYAWPSALERAAQQPGQTPTPNVARLSRELKAPGQQSK